jgi:magnesium transporter
LHPLHLEDCRHRNQNAKVEEGEGYIFVVLKPIEILDNGDLETGDLDLFLGRDFLITVMETDCAPVRRILDESKAPAGRLRSDQLFHRIMDGLVDSYEPRLDAFDDRIDGLEDKVLNDPAPATLQKILEIKRCLIEMRRVLANTRDVAGHLQRMQTELIQRDMWPFLRDVYDHLTRGVDRLEVQRDLLSGAMDIYLSSVANRTNQVMKVLTVMGTIVLPALVISSFYGMNLKHLPFVEHPHAMWIVTGVILAATALVLWVLKRFHWL